MKIDKDRPRPIPGYDPSPEAREAIASALEDFGMGRSAWYVRDTQGASVPAVVAMRAIDKLLEGRER